LIPHLPSCRSRRTLAAARWLLAAACLAQALAGLAWAEPASEAPPAPGADRASEEAPYFFYHRVNYGSDALVHPLRMVINGGFGIMQMDNHPNRPFDFDYASNWDNVWRNLSDPVASIENEGWGNFLRMEILPFSTSIKGARYWPNYLQHLIGGGMSYRLMAEWYRSHGYGRPVLWSVGTMLAYHLINEMAENNGYVGWTTDAVADLYLFDPLSIVLFSSDRVSGFFGRTLNMADWSFQPCIDPAYGSLENFGQNFTVKWRLPRSERWSLFYNYGNHGNAGFSFTRRDGRCLSVGAGLRAKELVDLTQGERTVNLVPSAGIYYDRNNSLLASLIASETRDAAWRLNLYPGLARFGPVAPGFFLALDHDDRIVMGVHLDLLPLGLAHGF
jgi:hypothetical protein